MPPSRRRPQDFTGREADRLAKERDEAAQERAAEITMTQQAQAEVKGEVVDYVSPPSAPEPSGPVEVRQPHRTVRINTDLEKVTYGAGTSYDFEAGRTYKLPSDFADHLDDKGFVWH
jgi:hypothetical protein